MKFPIDVTLWRPEGKLMNHRKSKLLPWKTISMPQRRAQKAIIELNIFVTVEVVGLFNAGSLVPENATFANAPITLAYQSITWKSAKLFQTSFDCMVGSRSSYGSPRRDSGTHERTVALFCSWAIIDRSHWHKQSLWTFSGRIHTKRKPRASSTPPLLVSSCLFSELHPTYLGLITNFAVRFPIRNRETRSTWLISFLGLRPGCPSTT